MIKLMDLLNEYNINKPGKYIIPVPNNEGAEHVEELGIDSGYYIRPTTYKNFKETIKNNFEEGDIEMYMDRFNSYPDNDINIENYTDDQLLDIIINEFGYVILNTEKEVKDYFEFLDYVVYNNNYDEEEKQQIYNSIDSADNTIWKIWPKPQFLNTLNEYKINKPNKYGGIDVFCNTHFKELEEMFGEIGSKFTLFTMSDGTEVAEAGSDEDNMINISFDPKYMEEWSDDYNEIEEIKIAGRTIYVNNCLYDYDDEEDNEDDDDELAEYEIKKPILFNTDSSKSKLWVDYNPKIRKIDGKELSLLNRVYSALKPVENRLDDSLRLSPSLDRVMMKYGYWEWIEDREILKALKDFNVEIEDDYDDDRGQTTYYMVKDK